MTVPVVRWNGCYDSGWNGLIVPEAFAHPAKMARGLVARIFDELFALGALQKGDTVCDPFGGIGTTGIEGASRGVQVVCCELEPKFVALAQQNFDLHRRDWEAMGRPQPRIIQGDSRHLRRHVGPVLVECVLSSPPYAGAKGHPSLGDIVDAPNGDILGRCTTGADRGDERYGDTEGQLGAMPEGDVEAIISSPPYVSGGHHPDQTGAWNTNDRGQVGNPKDVAGYGCEDGQLGQMREGAVDAVISSPPYAEIASGSGGLNTRPPKHAGQQGGRSASSASQDTDSRYGESDGQLARMSLGGVDAVVSSPPFTQGYAGGGGINVKGYGKDGADKVGARTYQGTGAERAEGNLETLALGEVDAVVSSPPWEKNVEGHMRADKWKSSADFLSAGRGHGCTDEARLAQLERDKHKTYGDSEGQLGQQQGETFWSAAQQIVAESFAILRPGGVAVFVVKAFVRNKAIVDFPGDWRKLCEHAGFETTLEVHAMLVSETVHADLFDGETVTTRSRKSFFRRLAEKKGSPAIDFETVLFMVKPRT